MEAATATENLTRMMNLDLANRARMGAAALKREVRDGRTPVARALWDERAACVPLVDLIAAQVRWGRTRARGWLIKLGLDDLTLHRRVDQLTDRQRRIVALAAPGR